MPKQVQSYEDELLSWMNTAGKYPLLSNEDTLEIARRIKGCEINSPEYTKLVNKLTVHNLRLVIKFVTVFLRKSQRKNFGCAETIDYLQVGSMGLRRAVELYDPSSGFKLSTYAYTWIRSFVGRYSRKNASVFHIPENAISDSWKFQKNGFLSRKNGTRKDISACLELTNNVRAAMSVASLDMTVELDSGDSVPISNLLESKYSMIEHGKFSNEVEDLFRSCNLSELQVEILRSIYLDEMDILKVSRIHNINRDKISKLKDSAIRALRKAEGLV